MPWGRRSSVAQLPSPRRSPIRVPAASAPWILALASQAPISLGILITPAEKLPVFTIPLSRTSLWAVRHFLRRLSFTQQKVSAAESSLLAHALVDLVHSRCRDNTYTPNVVRRLRRVEVLKQGELCDACLNSANVAHGPLVAFKANVLKRQTAANKYYSTLRALVRFEGWRSERSLSQHHLTCPAYDSCFSRFVRPCVTASATREKLAGAREEIRRSRHH